MKISIQSLLIFVPFFTYGIIGLISVHRINSKIGKKYSFREYLKAKKDNRLSKEELLIMRRYNLKQIALLLVVLIMSILIFNIIPTDEYVYF